MSENKITCEGCKHLVVGGFPEEPEHFCVKLGPNVKYNEAGRFAEVIDALDERPKDCPGFEKQEDTK